MIPRRARPRRFCRCCFWALELHGKGGVLGLDTVNDCYTMDLCLDFFLLYSYVGMGGRVPSISTLASVQLFGTGCASPPSCALGLFTPSIILDAVRIQVGQSPVSPVPAHGHRTVGLRKGVHTRGNKLQETVRTCTIVKICLSSVVPVQ